MFLDTLILVTLDRFSRYEGDLSLTVTLLTTASAQG
jgi:hypothetical protein